jgi:hypothetical protein
LVAPRPDSFEDGEVTAVTALPAPPEEVSALPTTPKKKVSAEAILSQDQVTEEKKSRTWMWAGIGCIVVIFFLIVVGLIAFDYLNLYCTPPFDTLFNFLYTCAP